jgi:hypothetical protein
MPVIDAMTLSIKGSKKLQIAAFPQAKMLQLSYTNLTNYLIIFTG